MWWKFQFECGGAGLFQDLEWTDTLVIQFLLWPWKAKVRGIEPDAISNLVIASDALSLVVLLLHSSCRFVECFLGLLVDYCHGFSKLVGGGVAKGRGSRRIWEDSRITTIEYHKGTFPSRAMDAVVMCEFSEREPVAPVSLSVVDEDAEILLHFLIDSFCLSVGLRVKGRRSI